MIRIVFSALFALVFLGTTTPAKAAFSLSYVSDFHSVPGNSTDLMSLNCPTGTTVVSGGWSATPGDGQYFNVWVSRQIGNGWRVMANNTAGGSRTIYGYAVCASGVTGLSSYSTTLSVNATSFNSGVGTHFCPSGGIPTGGGFDSNFPNPANLIVAANVPAYQNQWTAWEYNSTSSAKAFTIVLTCTKNLSATVLFRAGPQVQIGGGGYGESLAECNSGDFAIGGGFVTSVTTASPSTAIQNVRTFRSMPQSFNTRRWAAATRNNNQFDFAYLTAYAQCLHLL